MIELALVYWLKSIHLNIDLEDERIDHGCVKKIKNRAMIFEILIYILIFSVGDLEHQ
jgi:hypothetical protein